MVYPDIPKALMTIDIKINEQQLKQLEAYLDLIRQWNQKINLTAITEPKQMVSLHVVDSAVILPYIQGETLLDIGTGAGLPGVVLAILMPNIQVHLMDKNNKKCRFLVEVKSRLGLNNVQVTHAVAGAGQSIGFFDNIVARALCSLSDLVEMSGDYCHANTQILAMKGQNPLEELSVVKRLADVQQVIQLDIDQSEVSRHLVVLRPN